MSEETSAAHLAPRTSRAPEAKVIAATGGSGAGTVVAGAITWALEDFAFHGPVPDRLEAFIYLAATAGLALVTGYLAPHTSRAPRADTGS